MYKQMYPGAILMVATPIMLMPTLSYAQLNAAVTMGTLGSDTTISTDVQTSVEARSGTGVNTQIDAGANTGADLGHTMRNETATNTRQSELKLTAPLKVNALGIAVDSSSKVTTESDLNVFAENVRAKNDHIAKVDIDSDRDGTYEVKVVYRHKGRFLGLIPVTTKSTTVVEMKNNAEAEVRSRASWWSFLTMGDNYAESKLEANLRNNHTIKANLGVTSSAQTKAQVAEAVVAEVAAHANTQIAASI